VNASFFSGEIPLDTTETSHHWGSSAVLTASPPSEPEVELRTFLAPEVVCGDLRFPRGLCRSPTFAVWRPKLFHPGRLKLSGPVAVSGGLLTCLSLEGGRICWPRG